VKFIANGSTAKQIGVTTPELPCAGTAQNEPQFLVFYEPVNLVQEHRELLDLIDNHRIALRSTVQLGGH